MAYLVVVMILLAAFAVRCIVRQFSINSNLLASLVFQLCFSPAAATHLHGISTWPNKEILVRAASSAAPLLAQATTPASWLKIATL